MAQDVPAEVPLSDQLGQRSDTERLDWLISRGAWVAWNREGDLCRVFRRGDDEEDPAPEPVCGWSRFFDDARKAIDAAIIWA